MHVIVACVGCGMDPSTDALLINAAIAGGISGPWLLRGQLIGIARRILGRPGDEPPEASCALPTDRADNLDEDG